MAATPSPAPPSRRWKLKPREWRMLLYLGVVLGFAAWKFIPRPWHPTLTLERPHHRIQSTATRAQTEATVEALEHLQRAYSNRFGTLPTFQAAHPRMQVKLFKDRPEFRRVNPGLGWAEAFYKEPFCRAYFSAGENNPYHWMLHESAHQLNHEVARLRLEKWLEEGLAEYFSTSRLGTNGLSLGVIDPDTYPVWWIDELATTPDLAENLRNGSVIPLQAIVTGRGGPGMSRHVNLYYLHWWTLTHFIFESPQHRGQALKLAQEGGGLAAFERWVGPMGQVQEDWHAHVRRLKTELAAPVPMRRLRPTAETTAN